MTSSQALTINLIGTLSQDHGWLLKCLNVWLGRSDLRTIELSELEFAPARRSLHLNDQTRIDVLIIAVGNSGAEVIALEIKYADRFNSRCVDIDTPPYRELAHASNLWVMPEQVLTNRRLNQLARIHALASSYGQSLGISSAASVLVLSHGQDATATGIIDEYASYTRSPLVYRVSLRDAFKTVVSSSPAQHRSSAEDLQVRYGSESESSFLSKETS